MTTVDDIFSYIAHLDKDDKDTLYQEPFTCTSVFRSLPPLAQQIVLRMLLPNCPISAIFGEIPVQNFTPSSSDRQSCNKLRDSEAVEPLKRLGIFIALTDGSEDLQLNPHFRNSLIQGLAGDGCVDSAKKSKSHNPAQLNAFAWNKWEEVLYYMVKRSASTELSKGLISLLERADLIKRDNRQPMEGKERVSHQITQEGFQFLLKDVYTQLWIVIKQYLHKIADAQQAGWKLKILQFLFKLGYSKVGKAYSQKALDPMVAGILEELEEGFGLIYIPSSKGGKTTGDEPVKSKKYYYVTPLGLHLTSRSPERPILRDPEKQRDAGNGYIIVETNYRVYAYTDNPLQRALLNLFVDVQYHLPNLAVGMITRDSVLNALRAGISANQLLGYLYHRAHPEMQKNAQVLPETVVDQVRLWENERKRIQVQAGTLYKNFGSDVEYRSYKEEAERAGGLLYSLDAKQIIVVSRDCEEKLARIKARR